MRKLLGVLVVAGWAASLSAADVSALIKKLGSKDNEERREAAKELGGLGKDAKPAVAALTKALKDEDSFVRRWSADALGNVGPDAKDSLPALEKLLDDGKQPVRESAIKAMGKMGSAALPSLTKALKGTSDVQEHAIPALVSLGEPAGPALSSAIKDGKMNATLRRKAVAGVVKMGKAGRVAVGALAESVKKPSGGQEGQALRLESIAALGQLATAEDKEAVNVLEAIVKDEKQMNKQLKNAADKALKAIQARK